VKQVLLIDNYDSFTYNLVQYLTESGLAAVDVVKNDGLQLDRIVQYDGIILSPGPGLPADSGLLMQVFDHLGDKPLLGVCLGHQAIGLHFGAQLKHLDKVFHGIDSMISRERDGYPLFDQIGSRFRVGRYHSWVIDENTLAGTPLKVTCRDEKGNIMGIRHTTKEIHGVQFHPESIMTDDGKKMIHNFLRIS
jgi:anthranilate synthase component 2